MVAVHDTIRRRRAGIVLQLDSGGITVMGHPSIPWADVREISVTRMSPRWLTAGRALDVVAILPRDGVSMPDPPTYIDPAKPSRAAERRREQRLRQFGTNLTLMPYFLSASTHQITSIAPPSAGVLIRRLPTPRSWRLRFLLAPLFVFVTLVVLLITIVVR